VKVHKAEGRTDFDQARVPFREYGPSLYVDLGSRASQDVSAALPGTYVSAKSIV
jgi:hypothetical protein